MKYLYDCSADTITARKSYIKNIVDEVRGIILRAGGDQQYPPGPDSLALQVAEEAYNLPGVRVGGASARSSPAPTADVGHLGLVPAHQPGRPAAAPAGLTPMSIGWAR